MKLLNTNIQIHKKIAIALIIIILFNFIVPKRVEADIASEIFKPLTTIVWWVEDVIMGIIQVTLGGNFSVKTGTKPEQPTTEEMNDAVAGHRPYVVITENYNTGWTALLGLHNTVDYPNIQISPEEIFANKVPLFDINFISPNTTEKEQQGQNNPTHIAVIMRDTIRSWYNALKLIAIVGLLSVLIYLGIRIMLSSVAQKKAEYKQRMWDWVVALIIVFFIHYMMSFILVMTDELTNLFTDEKGDTQSIIVDYSPGRDVLSFLEHGDASFKTNVIGLIRFNINCDDFFKKMAYLVLYGMLIGQTFNFAKIYLTRVINMAFLTVVAPLIALTYPLDKAGDGQAQAFNMWWKEYLYNALIQPFHLLIYKLFVGTAAVVMMHGQDWQTDIVFAVFCIAIFRYIPKAEQLLKSLFGFGKASMGTVSGMGDIAKTALTHTALNKLTSANGGLAKGLKTAFGGGEEKSDEFKNVDENKGIKALASMGGSAIPGAGSYPEMTNNQAPSNGGGSQGKQGTQDSQDADQNSNSLDDNLNTGNINNQNSLNDNLNTGDMNNQDPLDDGINDENEGNSNDSNANDDVEDVTVSNNRADVHGAFKDWAKEKGFNNNRADVHGTYENMLNEQGKSNSTADVHGAAKLYEQENKKKTSELKREPPKLTAKKAKKLNKGGIARGLVNVGKTLGSNAGSSIKNSIERVKSDPGYYAGKLGKKLIRGYGRASAMLGAGMVSLIGGGDLKTTAAAMAGGYYLGGKAMDKVSDTARKLGIQDAFREGREGSVEKVQQRLEQEKNRERIKKAQEQAKKAKQKIHSKEIQDKLTSKYGANKKAYEERYQKLMAVHGVTDFSDAEKVMKLQDDMKDKGREVNDSTAVNILKMSKEMTEKDLYENEVRMNFMKNLSKKIQDNTGTKKKDADLAAQNSLYMIDLMHSYND